MSRKGTSTDNGMMESFFGILKTEMFYGFEESFKSLDHLGQAITDYIFYYNNKRIKAKLKDSALFSTEPNPFTNIFCPTFWGQYKFRRIFLFY